MYYIISHIFHLESYFENKPSSLLIVKSNNHWANVADNWLYHSMVYQDISVTKLDFRISINTIFLPKTKQTTLPQ